MPVSMQSDRSPGRGLRNRGLISFIALVLVALIVSPTILQSRTDRVREHRTEVINPARDQVSELQLALAVQMSSLRGFVITEDEDLLANYEDGLEREREAFERLQLYVDDLGPEVAASHAAFETLAGRWRGRITEAEILERRLAPEAYLERIHDEHALYEETLEAAHDLRDALLREAEENRQSIQAAERVHLYVNLGLVALAVTGVAAVLRVARRLRALADESESQRRRMQAATRAQSTMVRGISHDLRNPLSAAQMSLTLLESRGELDDRQREAAGRIARSLGSMNQIIEDLLSLARTESGALDLRPEEVKLAKLVRAAADDHRASAEEKGLSLQVKADPDLPTVKTDAHRVREIVRNLLSNAIKHTPRDGEIQIRAGTEQGGRWLAVRVSDTGAGIPAEAHERIFEEFTQLDGRRGGHGLGLHISRRVARALGGDITVHSESGEGSTFILWLPTRPGGGDPPAS